MTKRDVAVWFCRVVALVGMVSAGFGLVNVLITWQFAGVGRLLHPALSLGLHLFLWFFAGAIGTEIAVEGEYGPPITSTAELGALLLRCVGLWLFLSASLSFGVGLLIWAYGGFSFNPPQYARFRMTGMVVNFIESTIGFLLAFTLRLRTFVGKS